MRTARSILAAGLALTLFGSLAATAGWAWYLRSDYYAELVSGRLSETLGLESHIARVVPRSRVSREFRDITVWLPQRRDEALVCQRALLTLTPTPDDPNAYEIELHGGACEISTRTWLRQDYRGVVELGLRPGFSPDGPRRVHFSRMNLTFDRDRFRASLNQAVGQVAFDSHTRGSAQLVCRELNGHAPDQPIYLYAEFSPRPDGVRIDQLDLRVPRLPLHVARLEDLAAVPVRTGHFSGELTYAEQDAGHTLALSGRCFDLDLTECTTGLTSRPWRGRCPEIELAELRLADGRFERLRFRGVLRDVSLADVLATWGIDTQSGRLTLQVGEADLSQRSIRRFVASGQCVEVSLEELSAAAGLGLMTGTLRVRIDDLTIEDDRIKSLEALVQVDDAVDTPNWVEGRLLSALVSRMLGVSLPPVLPERIEYTRLGFRLKIQDEELFIFGTHGERDRTILTVRLFEREIALVSEPRRSFDLTPLLDDLRARAAARLPVVEGSPRPAATPSAEPPASSTARPHRP